LSSDPRDEGTSPLVTKFFELALATTQCSTEEAYLRSAISRVYFATHLLASAQARRKYQGFSVGGNADDHGAVIRVLRQGRARRLSDLLQDLREARNHADYHLDIPLEDCRYCKDGLTVELSDWERCRARAKTCFDGLSAL
jgi:hypothetical protein